MKHTRTCIKTLAIMLLLLFAAGPVLAEPPAAPSPAAKAQLQGTGEEHYRLSQQRRDL